MKNPFIKESNTGLLAVVVLLSAAAAGTVTYWLIKRRLAKADAAAFAKEHAGDYLKKKAAKIKKQKTDIHDLAKLVHA